PRDRDAASRRAGHAGGPPPSAANASRGKPRARRLALADGRRRDPADDARRDPDGHGYRDGARGGRGGAAPLHVLDLWSAGQYRRHARDAEHPRLDLHVLRATGPGAAPAGVGRGARPDDLYPRSRTLGPSAARAQQEEVDAMISRGDTIPIDVAPVEIAQRRGAPLPEQRETVFDIGDLAVLYSGSPAVRKINLEIYRNFITAVIGPSGCGKSTFLRCLNRMNDLVPGARVHGKLLYHGQDLYGEGVDPVEVRRRIGMVFQRPNPFPKSIYDNVAWG